MKTRLLEPVIRLLADVAADLLERGADSIPSRPQSKLAQAQTILRDQIGLLHVERHRTAKDINAVNAELATALANPAMAFRQAGLDAHLTALRQNHTAIQAEIDVLERTAAALAEATGPAARNPHQLAARLAELDRLMQDRPGETST